MSKLIVLAALVGFALPACVDDAGPNPAPTDDPAPKLSTTTTTGAIEGAINDSECRIQPTSDACIAACDPDPAAMDRFIKAGTCVLIRCTLEDGSSIGVGGCRPE